MYRIPKDLDLSPVVGQFTTQLRVGQFDFQFTLGEVHFGIQSSIDLFRSKALIGHWEEGQWPEPAFYEVMNIEVTCYQIPNDRVIVLEFANGIEMHLNDDSDHYESMQIRYKDFEWII